MHYALCIVFAAFAANAATLTYTGANGGSWDTASNWDGGAVPTIADDVIINTKWVKSAGSISAKSITVTGTATTLNAGLVVGGTTTTQDGIQAQTPADASTSRSSPPSCASPTPSPSRATSTPSAFGSTATPRGAASSSR